MRSDGFERTRTYSFEDAFQYVHFLLNSVQVSPVNKLHAKVTCFVINLCSKDADTKQNATKHHCMIEVKVTDLLKQMVRRLII